MGKIIISVLLILIFSSSLLSAQEEGQILDFNMTGYSKEGVRNWEIKGRSADISQDTIKLKDLEAIFYEKEKITLTSKEGIFFRKKNLIHLKKDVRLETSSGSILETDSLDYDGEKKILFSLDPVNIQRQDISIEGIGLEAKPDLKIAQLKKDIVLELGKSNPEKGKIRITCDGPLEIDYDKRIAIFNSNVKVEDREINITSDIMEVYFDPAFSATEKNKIREDGVEIESEEDVSGWKISRIIAKGNVKIVRGGSISYSQEAIYDAKEKKVTLTGKPELIIYSEERITLP